MTKNSNRKGLALGAIFALVSSLFVTAPAANANESGLVVQPIAGTSFTMVNTEDFVLSTRLGSLVQPGNAAALKYRIEKSGTSGYGLSISQTVSGTAQYAPAWSDVTTSNSVTTSYMVSASTVSVVAANTPTTTVGSTNQLRIQLFTASPNVMNSASPAANVTVTAFLDLDNNGEINGTEQFTTVVVAFVRTTAMGASVTLTQPVAGDTRITASATLTGVNHQQLGAQFRLILDQTDNAFAATNSGNISPATLAAGNYSFSADILPATASATIAQSLSATLYYNGDSSLETVVASSTLGVTSTVGFDGFTFSPAVGDNLTVSSGTAAIIRVNSSVTLSAWAFSGSVVATSVGTSWWFAVSGLSSEKFVVVNGVTYTNSATLPTASTAIAVAAGTKGDISLRTVGFDGTEQFTFTQRLGDKSATYTLDVDAPTFVLNSDAGNFAVVQPGASTAYGFTVRDQFGVLSNRVNQRVAAYSFAAARFSTSETVSANVVAGKASVTVATLPATSTGSATVRATLQRQDENTGSWVNVSGVDISLTVTTSAAIFTGRVTPTSSAVSISYGTAYSWSGNVTVPTNVAGAVVTVTATGLLIQNAAANVTASDTLVTRAASGGNLVLRFAGTKAGTYTVSYAVGSATTTSQIVVQPAVLANASTVNLSTTTLVPGQTNTVVATLVDANGNGIETATGNLVLAYSGKGLPFNMSGATDEDGKITFQVLLLAGETGTGTVTATIKRTSVVADHITVVRTLTIVPPAVVVAPTPEISAVIGTFSGRWAVRVENAKGAVVSVKVGNRWVKYTSLNDNYLFSRKSRVGATVPVAVYVNGQLENVATITIK